MKKDWRLVQIFRYCVHFSTYFLWFFCPSIHLAFCLSVCLSTLTNPLPEFDYFFPYVVGGVPFAGAERDIWGVYFGGGERVNVVYVSDCSCDNCGNQRYTCTAVHWRNAYVRWPELYVLYVRVHTWSTRELHWIEDMRTDIVYVYVCSGYMYALYVCVCVYA
jgi:hypothetical protein